MRKRLEKGQAIYLVAVGMVVLLGFAALAIDGGRILSDRRRAQNAADTAAFAAAFALIEETDPALEASAVQNAGLNRASSNGFDNADPNATVTINWPPIDEPETVGEEDYIGDDEYIQVVITFVPQTAFLQVVYTGNTDLTVQAISRAHDVDNDILGNAIVAMGRCGIQHEGVIDIAGGGHSGGVQTYNGGIFINADDDDADECCGLQPGESTGGWGITSDTSITSVGACDYSGDSMISPNPIETNYNDGISVDDPLAFLEEPICDTAGTQNGGKFTPGNWDGDDLGPGILEPGIYCVTGDLIIGNNFLVGERVLLYMIDGGIFTNGLGGVTLTAPIASDCLDDGDSESRDDSCTYAGIVIFGARGNTSEIDCRGNGSYALEGTIYMIDGRVCAYGGGFDEEETDVLGQIIANEIDGNGNGSFNITFDAQYVVNPPPAIDMIK